MLGYLRTQGFPDPEDVCAETFLQVVRDLERFSGDERGFRAWVLSIAHHRGCDARRHSARRPSEPATHESLELELPAVATDDEIFARLAEQEVADLLDVLSPDQREVLLLRLLGGLTTAEIAAATGRAREAVKGLQKRGIARLREHLGLAQGSADIKHPHPAPGMVGSGGRPGVVGSSPPIDGTER